MILFFLFFFCYLMRDISEDGELFCLFWKSLLYYIYKEFVILPVFWGEFIFCFLVYWIMFVFCFLLIILFVSRKSLKAYFLSTLQRYGRNTKGLIGVYFNFQDVFFNFSNDFFWWVIDSFFEWFPGLLNVLPFLFFIYHSSIFCIYMEVFLVGKE